MDAAQLRQWRDTLLKALANPRASVTAPNGSSVSFKSTTDIQKALADVERRLAAAEGRRVRVTYITSHKGL